MLHSTLLKLSYVITYWDPFVFQLSSRYNFLHVTIPWWFFAISLLTLFLTCKLWLQNFQGLPCHLYFDLEFSKKVNIIKNVDEMVDILISITLKALHDKYSIQGSQDWVIELDSSTEGMSLLLVIPLPCIDLFLDIH